MCSAWNLKTGGTKSKVLKRVVKHLYTSSRGAEGLRSRIDSIVGDPVHSGLPGTIRRSYTENFSALDHFDRDWYSIRFLHHPKDWKSHIVWSLLHGAIINARAVWCAHVKERMSVMDFLGVILAAYAHDSIS